MNITKTLCKKTFDWASNPRNTWMGIVWRALVALALMLVLSPFLVIEHFLREGTRPDVPSADCRFDPYVNNPYDPYHPDLR